MVKPGKINQKDKKKIKNVKNLEVLVQK